LADLDSAVERILQGDSSAFQEIVDATSARLVRLGARRMGALTDAEDVVQEGYVNAYQSIAGGRLDRRAMSGWLSDLPAEQRARDHAHGRRGPQRGGGG
jgi:DNA-directed RNA polymerase specialized sigma24 family protein